MAAWPFYQAQPLTHHWIINLINIFQHARSVEFLVPMGFMGLVYLSLHLPYKSTIHVGKYTIHGSYGGIRMGKIGKCLVKGYCRYPRSFLLDISPFPLPCIYPGQSASLFWTGLFSFDSFAGHSSKHNKNHQTSNEKRAPCRLGYMGDDKLPSYMGSIINHDIRIPPLTKDPSINQGFLH